MIYLQLFYEFFKIGLFAIGGGFAALPFLYDVSDRTGWFTHAQLADMIAISESTPGPIGINMATYVGFTTAGAPGSILATFALLLPSVILVHLIARFLHSFRENRVVVSALYGLRPASIGLIAVAGFTMLGISLFNVETYKSTGLLLDAVHWKGMVLAAVIFIILKKWNPHPVSVIALSAVVGMAFDFGGGF